MFIALNDDPPPQSLTLLKKEGLAEWFDQLKTKRRDFSTRLACDSLYKKISSHRVEEEEKEDQDDPPLPPMILVPITTPIDQPGVTEEVETVNIVFLMISQIPSYLCFAIIIISKIPSYLVLLIVQIGILHTSTHSHTHTLTVMHTDIASPPAEAPHTHCNAHSTVMHTNIASPPAEAPHTPLAPEEEDYRG